ncbi:DUF6233 domain-containing protein [Streptomyces sp. NPDC001185]|uniref:DUF6233 domain-containing protein n=1 Tax=Streptomyces sp. NPDC001185 TaxID=3154380 RepID=UPI0033339871
MSDLPPDPARLRAILAHLDRQLADADTIRTYLRLQREEVQRALQAASRPARPTRSTRPQLRPALTPAPFPAERSPSGPTGVGDGYMLEIKRHPTDPRPGVLHVDSCTMANRKTSPISAAQFRVAIRDTEYIETCSFCRPEAKPDDTAD